ncbi:helix-turn-helix transcriptional regulator [Kaistella carnis]|uniref:helix-turn-helix transcriptional regulator n=1 Tax=Kaistella carnis TaxID=1241979 RepID=UPI0028A24D0B|nr:WYL domain-containing protein [Kaistella carnis]
MSSNKNALIRYKTIDSCLRNRAKEYTLEDLIDVCSDALFEFEGKESFLSKRTIQLDIQNMRSEKLGYNAPIEVYDRKFYRYSDDTFSIKNIPVTEKDVQIINESIQLLKQFKDFSLFKQMSGVIQRLEDSVISGKNQKSIIHLDKNENLKGLEFIDVLYEAILKKKVLNVSYKSFKAREINQMQIHPQLLKEFNNRWFVICWHKTRIYNLALDRIEEIADDLAETYIDKNVDGDTYFNEVIGATVSERNRPTNVIFFVEKNNAPYVKTKPFHHSQEVLEENENGTLFKIKVQLNFELERMILGFGDLITVMQPQKLRMRIEQTLKNAVKNYRD